MASYQPATVSQPNLKGAKEDGVYEFLLPVRLPVAKVLGINAACSMQNVQTYVTQRRRFRLEFLIYTRNLR